MHIRIGVGPTYGPGAARPVPPPATYGYGPGYGPHHVPHHVPPPHHHHHPPGYGYGPRY